MNNEKNKKNLSIVALVFCGIELISNIVLLVLHFVYGLDSDSNNLYSLISNIPFWMVSAGISIYCIIKYKDKLSIFILVFSIIEPIIFTLIFVIMFLFPIINTL